MILKLCLSMFLSVFTKSFMKLKKACQRIEVYSYSYMKWSQNNNKHYNHNNYNIIQIRNLFQSTTGPEYFWKKCSSGQLFALLGCLTNKNMMMLCDPA